MITIFISIIKPYINLQIFNTYMFASTPSKTILMAWLALLWVSDITDAETGSAQLDRLMLQWSETEQQHSVLEAQWLKRRAILDQQLSLLDAEHKALTKALSQSHSSEVEQKRAELLQLQIQMEREQTELANTLEGSLINISDLQYRLPPPLQDQWQETLAEITANKADTSKRLEGLLQLLSQLEDFDRRVALHQTVMNLDGTDVQVQQFYLGLSQGWYVDQGGHYAGYGFSSAQGWQWRPHEKVEGLNPDDLLTVVNILQNRAPANFIALPIYLENTQGKNKNRLAKAPSL